MRNIYEYNKIYSGADPVFIEDDVFKTIIPLYPDESNQASMQAEESDKEIEIILEFCKGPKSRAEIQEFLGYKKVIGFGIHLTLQSGLIKKYSN